MISEERVLAKLAETKRRADAVLKNLMFEYLDSVRESGVQDMMAVVPSLEAEFGLTRQEARSVLKSWRLVSVTHCQEMSSHEP